MEELESRNARLTNASKQHSASNRLQKYNLSTIDATESSTMLSSRKMFKANQTHLKEKQANKYKLQYMPMAKTIAYGCDF